MVFFFLVTLFVNCPRCSLSRCYPFDLNSFSFYLRNFYFDSIRLFVCRSPPPVRKRRWNTRGFILKIFFFFDWAFFSVAFFIYFFRFYNPYRFNRFIFPVLFSGRRLSPLRFDSEKYTWCVPSQNILIRLLHAVY